MRPDGPNLMIFNFFSFYAIFLNASAFCLSIVSFAGLNVLVPSTTPSSSNLLLGFWQGSGNQTNTSCKNMVSNILANEPVKAPELECGYFHNFFG